MNKIVGLTCLIFVIVGILLVSRGDEIGWVGVAIFGLCLVVSIIEFFLKRWITHLPPDHFLMRLRNNVEVPDPKLGSLTCGSDGLTHHLLDGTCHRILWKNVDRITTYKIDLLTTDCICLLFAGDNLEPPYQIYEEMVGFTTLFEPLRDAFPTIPDSWYFDVMTPPFEAKHRVLFDRSIHGGLE